MDGFNGIADFIWEEDAMMINVKFKGVYLFLDLEEDGALIFTINV